MSRATLTKEFKFEAAHDLPNHDGHCRDLHGHSYHGVVTIEGEIKPADGKPDEGMVADFHIIKDVTDQLDHTYLNDVIADRPTTAENIAGWIADALILDRPDLRITVLLHETASSSVTVTR